MRSSMVEGSVKLFLVQGRRKQVYIDVEPFQVPVICTKRPTHLQTTIPHITSYYLCNVNHHTLYIKVALYLH